jgi:chaperonin GroEL
MIEKDIDYGHEAKNKLRSGVNKLSEAVKTTLGAGGNTVILEDELGRPHITKDGVTVAKSINLSDPVEHLGASILKQVAIKSASEAGDGTTTSIVLAQSLINNAFDSIEGTNLNVTKFRNELEKASKLVIDELTRKSKEVNETNLANVASISANNDEELGKIIADAYKEVGIDGAVTIEQSNNGNTYTKIIEGTRMKKGYHSPYMVTDKERNQAVLEKPFVAICDKKVNTIEDIEPLLQQALMKKRPILIVGEIETAVMNTLNVNKARGVLQINVVSPEGVGRQRFELLEDLAIMTGATVISDETGTDFSAVTAEFLGEAVKAVSTETETIITLGQTNDETKERADMMRKAIKENDGSISMFHLKDRLARLSGGIAAIHVGAFTEVEMKEKKDRVEDAIWATRSALEEGIVAGGGVALFNASQKLYTLSSNAKGLEEKAAIDCLIAALQTPMKVILENSGNDLLTFQEKIEKIRRRGYGMDVKTGRFGNMFDMGIIDPLKVTKNAVMNSVSVAITVLTTNCVVSNKRA